METLAEGILRRVAEMEQEWKRAHALLHEAERKIAEKEEQIRSLHYMVARAEAAMVEWMKKAEAPDVKVS